MEILLVIFENACTTQEPAPAYGIGVGVHFAFSRARGLCTEVDRKYPVIPTEGYNSRCFYADLMDRLLAFYVFTLAVPDFPRHQRERRRYQNLLTTSKPAPSPREGPAAPNLVMRNPQRVWM